MIEGKIYPAVGTSAGTTPDGQEVVGLLLPKENPVNENDFDEIYFPIPVAQGLILDLKDAIDACIEHKSNGG